MKKTGMLATFCALALLTAFLPAQKKGIEPPTKAWTAKIRDLAPGPVSNAPEKPRKVLLFWLHTGFDHKVIPHVNEVMKVLAEKSKAFEVDLTLDIEKFSSESLAKYDAVILNNNCSQRKYRDIFRDVLDNRITAAHKGLGAKYADLTPEQREKKAAVLEKSLIDFVASGKGLVLIHGAIVMLNESKPFAEMVGANFTHHPAHQDITYAPTEPDHPLLKCLGGKTLTFRDELYLYGPPYAGKNFRPLLKIDTRNLKHKGDKKDKKTPEEVIGAWIKRHEKGRIFYCSPGHYPASYESKEMLAFLLAGMRYAFGDLAAPDTPLPAKK